jgi:hypothetical protein
LKNISDGSIKIRKKGAEIIHKKNKIEEKLKKQLNALKKMEIESKIREINNHFKKKGLNGVIFEEKGTQFHLNVYSFMGPEEETDIAGPKNRLKLFGPYEPKIVEFCNKTSFYMNRKLWNNTKDRFHEVVVRETPVKGPIHILPIKQYLEEDIENDPKFFRKKGPLWIDLDSSGYVVERDEVDEIIDRFKDNQFQLLIGEAASGKTAIVASIGYKLAKEQRWNVNILSSKTFQYTAVDNLAKEMDFFNPQTEDALIIIEDFHKNASDIAYILEHMIPKKSKFLLVARGSYKIGLQQEELEFLDRFKVKELGKKNFCRIADDLKKAYIEKLDNSEHKKELQKLSSERFNEIKKVADGNLWLLAYFLEAWTPDKEINMGLVYDKIKKDIDDLEAEFSNKYNLRGIPEILLLLSPFSVIEIGVRKLFLDKVYGLIKPELLEKLSKYGEIECVRGYYYIPHSTLAQLYIETATSKSNRRYRLDTIIDFIHKLSGNRNLVTVEDYPSIIYQIYIQKYPKYYGWICRYLCFYESRFFYFERRKSKMFYDRVMNQLIFSKMFQDIKTYKTLIKCINTEKNITNLGMFFEGIYFLPTTFKHPSLFKNHNIQNVWKDYIHINDKIMLKIINNINIDSLVDKLESETSLDKIAFCLYNMAITRIAKLNHMLIKKLNISDFKLKMKQNDINSDKSFMAICALLLMDKTLYPTFKELLISKIKKENDLKKLRLMLKYLHMLKGEGTKEIANYIRPKRLITVFKKEKDLSMIQSILFYYTDWLSDCKNSIWISEEHSKSLLTILIQKINEEQDVHNICFLLRNILYSRVKKSYVKNMLNNIDVDLLKSKVKLDGRKHLLGIIITTYPGFSRERINERIDVVKITIDKLDFWNFIPNEVIEKFNKFIKNKKLPLKGIKTITT